MNKILLQKLFSIKEQNRHKIYTLFGLKFKFKTRTSIEYLEKLIIKQNSDNHEKILRITPHSKLRNFEVHIVEHCNLNCQCCNHYSPLAEKKFLSPETFKKDLTRIAELTNSEVDYINLLGGEPLLHPNLIDFLPIARKLFPNTILNVVTNGILLNRQKEEFWKACKENNITLWMTKYPININYADIEKTAKSYNIVTHYMGNEEVKHSWFFPINLEGNLYAKENFINCQDANNCIFLRDGKLYTCVVPPNIHHFNKYFDKDIKVTERDYIDIYKVNNISEILNFLAKPIPFCSYCEVAKRKFDLKWKTTEKDIKEWIS